ncbi:MAG TPA: hypothetical protein VHD31_02045 [Candidatus Paceibacterota bacterium]|nr:hypothetical protein [Candidatus Paceibacterota bacterium]
MSRVILSIAGVVGIALMVAWTLSLPTTNKVEPGLLGTPTPTQEEKADASIGQFTERQNSPPTSSRQAPAAPAALAEGCGLHFSFVPSTKLIQPGGSITYTFTVSNQGTEACQNTSFSAYYDDAETFVSASPAPTASTYYWSLGTLSSRAQKVISATTRASASAAQLNNEACATADNSSDVCAQNTMFVGASAPAVAVSSPAQSISSVAPSTAAKKEMGLWVWDTPAEMPTGYAARMLTAAAQNGFNTLYITVDDYLDIAALPDGADKTAKKQKYFGALASIVSAANQKSIAIDIEGGAKDWAYPENRWKGYALINFLSEYNKLYPLAQVRGLQYDVEPYLLPKYQDNKAQVLTQFLEFIDESTTRMQKVEGKLSVVIPHFYDSKQAWTPAVSYKGTTAYTFTQLLKILERKPGSSLIVMAYRNFFEGDGGTREISQAEIDEASTGGYSTSIVVAQETGNVDPSYVTFYGLSKSDLLASIKDIYSAFDSDQNFGGVAIHYLEPFLDLK